VQQMLIPRAGEANQVKIEHPYIIIGKLAAC